VCGTAPGQTVVMSQPPLLLALDLTGTFAFGLNGALTAVRMVRLDLVGVLTLGMMTALGGGILRDILIGSLPPATFSDVLYLGVAAGGALVAFFISVELERFAKLITIFDAVGLGVFCVTGASKALAYGLGGVQAVLLGALTAVGGGTLRDVAIKRVPSVLTSDFYAVPALVGAALTVLAVNLGIYGIASALVAAAVCFTIRMLGVRYSLRVPSTPRRDGAGRPPVAHPGRGSARTTRGETSMDTSRASAVLADLDTALSWQEDFYRDLHAHPELSHQETRTASLVAERLRESDYQVHEKVGGTGVVGVLANGDGPTVLLRADMDALPVREATGLPYASTATADGEPVMHACGHDVHVACLLGAAQLMASATGRWNGTLVVLFQPAEEVADGARGMVEDGLRALIPRPDVALAQHVLPIPAGTVATNAGPTLAAADSMRITVHGRGAHGSMPQSAIDPVVLASMIVVRLQTVVAREIAPGEPTVLTVGSVRAGTKSNIIPDRAEIQLNIRTYSERTRADVLDAIERIVTAECQASKSPREPEFELFERFPVTDNDASSTGRVAEAFAGHFGDRAGPLGQWAASEDFSDLATAFEIPYTYWGIGGIDPDLFERGSQDVPANHSPTFAPVIQPTLTTGTQALVVAALAWL
jgi:amidohydrolase